MPHSTTRSAQSRKRYRSRSGGGRAPGDRHEVGLVAPIPFAAGAGPRPLIPRGLQAGRQPPLARLGDRHRRGLQHRGNRRRRPLYIGQKQRGRPTNWAGGGVTRRGEGIEQPTLMLIQLHRLVLGHRFLLARGS
jgi:hypothetical protein